MDPIVIKKGWAKVRIYECPLHRGDEEYMTYIISWYIGKKRMRRGMASLELAKREAKAIAEQLADGSATTTEITQKELQYYRQCENMLNGVPLDRAVKAYIEQNPKEVKQIRLKDLVEEFLKRNDADPNLSKAQKSNTRKHLIRLADKMNRPISVIESRDIDEYLDDPSYAPRTRHNHRSSIIVLFNYARRKGYLIEDKRHAAEKSKEIRLKRPDVEIYSPEQAEAMLHLAEAKLIPFLAISLFSGVRTAELCRLGWADIDWVGGNIRLDRKITKTNQSRLVPLLPNLAEWLAPYKGKKGNIMASMGTKEPIRLVSQWLIDSENPKLPSNWNNNRMSDTFAMYYFIYTGDSKSTGLACGLAPDILRKFYKSLCKFNYSLNPQIAKRYFEIRPSNKLHSSKRQYAKQKKS
jgi:integrase